MEKIGSEEIVEDNISRNKVFQRRDQKLFIIIISIILSVLLIAIFGIVYQVNHSLQKVLQNNTGALQNLTSLAEDQKCPSKTRQVITKTIYGFNLCVDTTDQIVSSTIIQRGTWQRYNIQLILPLVKPGDNILNLGSQSGLQAMVLGRQIGNTGRVFIFEPYSFSNYLVRINAVLAGIDNYTQIYKLGASNYTGVSYMRINTENTGASRIINKKTRFNQEINIQKVDNVLPKDVKLNFALIDVEGLQAQALMGMKQVIKRSPQLIIFIQWRKKKDTYWRQIQKFLIEQSYRFYIFNHNKFTLTQAKLQSIKNMEDVLMVPKSIDYKKLLK